MIRVIRTIDAHVGGQAVRLVVEGMPTPVGATRARQQVWLSRHADGLRRALVFPPRGQEDLTVAMLTRSASADAHAGVVFMDAAGYPSMSGHTIMALTTIALERGLFFSREVDSSEARLVFDTPAGAVRAVARLKSHKDAHRVDAVAVTNVPAFVHTPSQAVTLRGRTLRVDIAFGGAFYAIADTEATGVPLDSAHLPDLRRLGSDVCDALNRSSAVRHPTDGSLTGVTGVVFTGLAHDPEAHLRNLLVRSTGAVDLSGSGTGTAAVMAVLDAMGMLPGGQPFVHEGLAGALVRGRVTGRTMVGETAGLVTEVEGSAWVTGEHTFFLDDDDPLTMRLS